LAEQQKQSAKSATEQATSVGSTTPVIDLSTLMAVNSPVPSTNIKKVIFTNNSSQEAFIAIAYYDGNSWVSKGWYGLEPGASGVCFNEIYKWEKLYWYAVCANGSKWEGNDAKFCIDKHNTFEFPETKVCPDSVGFFSLKLSNNTTTQVLAD